MFHAAEQRMRPMLMTALSACIGLLPAAVSTGIGSQVQRPLAAVVVVGHASWSVRCERHRLGHFLRGASC
jgi:Cu/Ag efflux pump CusA